MIAVIADDLTGAAEIAGIGWRHGLTAEIVDPDATPGRSGLIVYNSDSRNCPPREARRRVARIVRRIQARRPAWIFKKVDSVLRGNVIAEIRAALAALRLNRCLLVSANPNAGRIIRHGQYYIQGTPIHRTDFRHDPRHPRLSARVTELLDLPQTRRLTLLPAGTEPLRNGINIGEVASFDDVQHWARLADEQTLAAGGADFFQALLREDQIRSAKSTPLRGKRRRAIWRPADSKVKRPEGRAPFSRFERLPRTLFVCGSLAESSFRFLDRCRLKGWPVLLMPGALLAGACSTGSHSSQRPASEAVAAGVSWAREITRTMRAHPVVVVGIGRPLIPGTQAPLRLGSMLIDTVWRVLRKTRPDRLCVEGGATAAMLTQRMGWNRLELTDELSAGVAALRPCGRGRALSVLVKPGSYEWPAHLR